MHNRSTTKHGGTSLKYFLARNFVKIFSCFYRNRRKWDDFEDIYDGEILMVKNGYA